MLAWFVLGICLLLGIGLAGRWFATADPKLLVKVITSLGLTVFLTVVVFLAVTGRLAIVIPLLVAGFWWIVRSSLKNLILGRVRQAFQSTGSQAGSDRSQSEVKTGFLRMKLDHTTGAISGEVLRGRFEGRQLTELSTSQVVELIEECRGQDPKSASLLETWLDRTAGPDWRERTRNGKGDDYDGKSAPGGTMTRAEALEVLGLTGNPSAEDIKAAHHRLMQKIHPDLGGSTYLATKINEARDLLINT
jgi:hypothetical protein